MLKRMSFKYKLLVTFLLFYLIPLLIVSIVSYTFLENTVSQKTIANHQAILDNTKTQIDKSIEVLEKYNMQLLQKPWVESFRYMATNSNKVYDAFDIRKFSEELKIFSTANEMANDVSIYFSKSQKLISSLSSNLESLDFFVDNIFFADNMKNLLTSQFATSPCIVLKDAYNYKRRIDGVIIAYPMRFENANTDEGVVIFYFISNATLTGIMNNNIKNASLITYEDENVAVSNMQDGLLDHVKDKMQEDGHFKNPIKVDGESHYVLSSSGRNEWTFYSIVPMATISNDFTVFKISFIIGITFFSVLGFICSYYSAIRNYRPLEKIIQKINVSENSTKVHTDEFLWLGCAIEVIMNKEQNLTSQIESQRSMLCSTYLAWLLKSKEKKEEAAIKKALSYLDLHMDSLWFNVIVCSDDSPSLNEIFEKSAEECQIKLFKIDDGNKIDFLVNFDQQEDLDLFLQQVQTGLLTIQKSLFIGVGVSTNEIASLALAYSQAGFACDFSKINENDAITFFSSITSLSGGYYYPLDKESSIKNYLKSGDYEKAEEIFMEVSARNFKSKPVSLERMRNFFSDAQNTCLKVMDEIGMEDDFVLEAESISSLSSLSVCEERIREIYKSICAFVAGNQHVFDDALKDEICSYIDDHFSQSDFSLSTIADKMKMSTSYVSKLLKQYLGCNFLDYINHKRIDRAKELLMGAPKMEVGEIAVVVGYDNDTTFRRIFKKYEGVTPMQFRQANQL